MPSPNVRRAPRSRPPVKPLIAWPSPMLLTTCLTWSAKMTPRLPSAAAASTFVSSSRPKSHHFSVLPSGANGSTPASTFWASAFREIIVSWPLAPGANDPVISTGRALPALVATLPAYVSMGGWPRP